MAHTQTPQTHPTCRRCCGTGEWHGRGICFGCNGTGRRIPMPVISEEQELRDRIEYEHGEAFRMDRARDRAIRSAARAAR